WSRASFSVVGDEAWHRGHVPHRRLGLSRGGPMCPPLFTRAIESPPGSWANTRVRPCVRSGRTAVGLYFFERFGSTAFAGGAGSEDFLVSDFDSNTAGASVFFS